MNKPCGSSVNTATGRRRLVTPSRPSGCHRLQTIEQFGLRNMSPLLDGLRATAAAFTVPRRITNENGGACEIRRLVLANAPSLE
jgi:hypothetical protein